MRRTGSENQLRIRLAVDPGWRREDVIASLCPFSQSENLTPDAPEPLRRYLAWYHLWPRAGASLRLGTLDVAGYQVVVHRYAPEHPRGTVLVLHGYFDHVGLYRHLIHFLLEEGYAVVTWDQPGHGLSSGELVAIESFAEYQDVIDAVLDHMAAHESLPDWVGAVGQSTGCAALTEFILTHRESDRWRRLPRYVYLAPLLRPAHFRKARILYRLLSPFRRTWKREFSVNSHDPDFIRFLRTEDPLQPQILSVKWVGALQKWIRRVELSEPVEGVPLLIVQGDEDRTVDWRHNLPAYRRLFPGSQSLLLPGLRHQVVNETEEYRLKVWSLIRKHLDAGA
ncbi:MAG: alpha/beta hydrolase [Gammaproteobacteria bacterium]|nr:MAG: alpha/beta hydrolase [Gammaproteobacteria bacterium]